MKKIYLSIIIISFSIQADAQSGIIYDTCFSLRQYQGEWRNVNGQDTIKVYFRVQYFYSQPNNLIRAELLGWLEYKISNNIILSDYSHRFNVLPANFSQKHEANSSMSLAYSDCSQTIHNLYGGMNDPLKNNRAQNWKTTRLSSTTIRVDQIAGEAVYGVPFIPGFTLPQTFVLTKQ